MKKWLIIMIIFLFLYNSCSYYSYKKIQYFQENIIPGDIRLTDEYWASDDGSIGLGSCGAAVFGLSDITVQKIRQKGLGFFDGMTRSGNGEEISKWSKGDYAFFTREGRTGVPMGIDCAGTTSLFGVPYEDRIRQGISNSDFYMTSGRRGLLIVLPDQKLLVFSHRR